MRMIKGLEIFWLVVTIAALGLVAYEAATDTLKNAMLTAAIALLAGFKYYVRRRQRIKMENES